MFCTECGAEIKSGGKFCGKCGIAISFGEDNFALNQTSQTNESSSYSAGHDQQRKYDYELDRNLVSDQKSTPESNNNGLIQAFKRRQKDTGWGWALAHAIPFANSVVAIFYAISRRTITPLLIYLTSCFAAGVVIAIFSYELSQDDGFATLIVLLLAPFTIKIGISKARRYAKKRLTQDSL